MRRRWGMRWRDFFDIAPRGAVPNWRSSPAQRDSASEGLPSEKRKQRSSTSALMSFSFQNFFALEPLDAVRWLEVKIQRCSWGGDSGWS